MPRGAVHMVQRMNRVPPQVQVALVLTSDGADVYAAMARMVVASIRISDPQARVVLVCDQATERGLVAMNSPLLTEGAELLPVEVPEGSAAFRSRYLKTSLRRIMKGAFVFLDLDVLVRGSLAELFHQDTDVAGAVNHSFNEPERQMGAAGRKYFAEAGWTLPVGPYINTGVRYMNDTDAAHELGRRWHAKWVEGVGQSGSYLDQPVFNWVLGQVPIRFHCLPHRFNAQFMANAATVKAATVWHYYGSSRLDLRTAYGIEVGRLMEGGAMDLSRVRSLMNAPHPWRRKGWLDDVVGARITHVGYIEPWADLWFRGDRRKALQALFAAFRRRLKV